MTSLASALMALMARGPQRPSWPLWPSWPSFDLWPRGPPWPSWPSWPSGSGQGGRRGSTEVADKMLNEPPFICIAVYQISLFSTPKLYLVSTSNYFILFLEMKRETKPNKQAHSNKHLLAIACAMSTEYKYFHSRSFIFVGALPTPSMMLVYVNVVPRLVD
jgi:hypothetical protein